MANPSLKEVEQAIMESVSLPVNANHLDHLRLTMNGLGYNFPDSNSGRQKTYIEAMNHWWNINEEKKPLAEIPIKVPKDLPTISVKWNGKDYHIHSILHYNPHPSESVKKFVQSRADAYNERGILFTESGIKEYFGIERSIPFRDQVEMSKLDWKRYSLSRKKISLERRLGNLKDRLLHEKKNENIRTVLDLYTKAGKDISYLPRAMEAGSRQTLPEPLLMEYLSCDGLYDKIANDRTKLMALRWTNLTKDSNLENHSIIANCHGTGVEYLMKNPELLKQ